MNGFSTGMSVLGFPSANNQARICRSREMARVSACISETRAIDQGAITAASVSGFRTMSRLRIWDDMLTGGAERAGRLSGP